MIGQAHGWPAGPQVLLTIALAIAIGYVVRTSWLALVPVALVGVYLVVITAGSWSKLTDRGGLVLLGLELAAGLSFGSFISRRRAHARLQRRAER